jgi:hypothetical protein
MHSFTKRGLVGLSVVVAVAGVASSPAWAKSADFTVKPVAGRNTTSDDTGRWVGGGADAKAYRNADGTSYTLTKNATLETWAYAALEIGVQGRTLDELGTLTYTVDGNLTNGSPRVNLSYTDADGDDLKFLGGLAAADPDGVVTVDLDAVSGDANAKVVSLDIIRDEPGTSIVSNIGFTRPAA